ncbi:NRDE family protein [Pseudofulvibacter geojedonensis]|uniref:NRDE family protein n=1 Tax=Pseudofulvibacter geojedonensis TaxID=1123758 RepID=A0ABW3I1H1_9FLAO
MCTVSYLPQNKENFVFTSNRDEAVGRETIAPRVYLGKEVKFLMPKDKLAGGSWIGVSDKKRLVCLLNGGFEKHVRKSNYRHSRGKVVINFLQVDDFQELLYSCILKDIEPFTLIVIDWSENLVAHELIWDGVEKHISQLDVNKPKIWSSSTLYTQEMKQIRNQWFLDYFSDKEFSKENALEFHENFGVGDKDVDLQIDRGHLKTVSITNVVKNGDEIDMLYKDLLKDLVFLENINSVVVHG